MVWARAAAFVLTAAIMTTVQLAVPRSVILTERFLPGGGWLLVAALPVYAAWLAGAMLHPARQPLLRRRMWLLFSIVFFGELLLGLAGFELFLMTGKLHFPIPALILAGPVYRGTGFFMPVLFLSTIVLVGPAWCSHLCYVGAWDDLLSLRKTKPAPLPAWAGWARAGILACVLVAAAVLGATGASIAVAGGLALAFGLAGVVVMILGSRRLGVMVHCTVFCPVGLAADVLGRISPFRIRIGEGCTRCGSCSRACRYDALGPADIERGRPALSCSLCGDCVGRCGQMAMGFGLGRLDPRLARAAFIVVVVSLHAAFLGIARI